MASERGQATIEWTALVLLVALAFAAFVAAGVPHVDGRSYGGRLPRASSQGSAGVPATVFTHVAREGGHTFIQYWFYYPDSNTTWAGSDKAWKVGTAPLALGHKLWGKVPKPPRYPGFHHDDWEGYQVELGDGEDVRVRATAHHGYQYCKQRQCTNEWGPWTGWTRVSRGSHAGHIPLDTRLRGVSLAKGFPYLRGSYRIRRPAYPGIDLHERTTVGSDLRLVPLETMARGSTPNFDGISPPWRKPVYDDPL